MHPYLSLHSKNKDVASRWKSMKAMWNPFRTFREIPTRQSATRPCLRLQASTTDAQECISPIPCGWTHPALTPYLSSFSSSFYVFCPSSSLLFCLTSFQSHVLRSLTTATTIEEALYRKRELWNVLRRNVRNALQRYNQRLRSCEGGYQANFTIHNSIRHLFLSRYWWRTRRDQYPTHLFAYLRKHWIVTAQRYQLLRCGVVRLRKAYDHAKRRVVQDHQQQTPCVYGQRCGSAFSYEKGEKGM